MHDCFFLNYRPDLSDDSSCYMCCCTHSLDLWCRRGGMAAGGFTLDPIFSLTEAIFPQLLLFSRSNNQPWEVHLFFFYIYKKQILTNSCFSFASICVLIALLFNTTQQSFMEVLLSCDLWTGDEAVLNTAWFSMSYGAHCVWIIQ